MASQVLQNEKPKRWIPLSGKYPSFRLLLLPMVGWMLVVQSLQTALRCPFSGSGTRVDTPAVDYQPTRIASQYPHSNESAALCVIAKDSEAYLDEWIDYHYYVLGFDAFYVYDNSEQHFLHQWGQRPRQQEKNITVIHWPGLQQQRPAYYHCAVTRGPRHTWLAFWDDDEFLVFQQQEQHIVDFLHDKVAADPTIGAVSFNWLTMGTANQSTYEPRPVLQRFDLSDPTLFRNKHVKSIIRTTAYKRVFDHIHHNPHAHFLKSRYKQVSPSGRVLYQSRPPHTRDNSNTTTTADTTESSLPSFFNEPFELDQVVIHHYRTKSIKEWGHKGARGRASSTEPPVAFDESVRRPTETGTTRNVRAWQLLQHYVPKYTLFNPDSGGPLAA